MFVADEDGLCAIELLADMTADPVSAAQLHMIDDATSGKEGTGIALTGGSLGRAQRHIKAGKDTVLVGQRCCRADRQDGGKQNEGS
jgi:hypothetical protein